MSAQEQITKLQGLLARIQRNAVKQRTAGAPIAFAPVVAAPAPAPLAYAAPPPPAAVDQSVDDLLSAAPVPSPIPVEVDVPLDTIPPVAPVAAASEAPESAPIPLVSVATAQPAEPAPPAEPVDDTFSLESEVSEVRMATISREPAVEVTVAAIEAEAEPIGTEELSEDDLVEVTDLTSAPPPAATDVDIDFEDEDEEQPPASSQRKVASTMDEALAAAAAQLDAEREVPLKTPPPESGPQEAPPAAGFSAPPAPDVDALLGQELDIPTRESSSMAVAAPVGPTTEQLGQTIDLDEARGPSLELAEAPVVEVSTSAEEELEVALPGRGVGGGYDDALQPPPEAQNDLEAHRRRLESDMAPPPESLAQLPSVQPPPVDIVPAVVEVEADLAPVIEVAPAVEAPQALEAAPLAPEITSRPVSFGSPETFAAVREPFRPSSFSELLDASLALNGD